MKRKSKYNHQIRKFLFTDWLTGSVSDISVLFKEPLLICLGRGLILGLRTKLHGADSIVTVVGTGTETLIYFIDSAGCRRKSKRVIFLFRSIILFFWTY